MNGNGKQTSASPIAAVSSILVAIFLVPAGIVIANVTVAYDPVP